MNENRLTIVKEYKFDNPLRTRIDSIKASCYRGRHKNYFHTFKYESFYDNEPKNITKNEIFFLKISDKSMGLFQLSKKLTVARQSGFIFTHKNKLTIISCSNLSNTNIKYCLTHRIPIMHRHFFRKITQRHDYVQTYFNNRNNLFHFACRKWYLYNIPQC